MESKPTVRNGGMADWMEEFINKFRPKNVKIAESIKESEINVKNLGKIVWNDETYYVDFTNGGATVYNEFANEVTTVKGAHTVEDVDNALNSHQVVTGAAAGTPVNSSKLFMDSVVNALSSLDKTAGEFDPQGTTPGPNGAAETTQPTPPAPSVTSNATTAPVSAPPTTLDDQQYAAEENANVSGVPSVNPVTTAPVNTSTTASEDEGGHKTVGDMIDDVKGEDTKASINNSIYHTVVDPLNNKISEVESMLRKIEADLDNLAPIPQEYARHDLKEVGYPTNQMEQDHFTPEANSSMAEIDREDSTDITNPKGRTDLFKRLIPKNKSYAEQIYENNDAMAPTAVPNVDEDHTPGKNDVVNNEPSFVDEGEGSQLNNALTLSEENAEETEFDGDTHIQKDSATDNPEEKGKADKPELRTSKLIGKDLNIFKNGVCPSCGDKKLTLANTFHQYQGVYCALCDSEYAIDTDKEEVYQKN